MRCLLSFLFLTFFFACNSPQKKLHSYALLSAKSVFEKDSVRNFLAAVSETQADSSKAVFLKAVNLLKNENKPGPAAEAFVQSLCIYPTANAYYELGNAYLRIKAWQKALRSFEMAESMDYSPFGNVLFAQAACYAEMDSADKAYNYLTYAVQSGFVDRQKILKNPHLARLENNDRLLSVYNEAMSGNGDPDEVLWQGYVQDFRPAKFPLTVDSGSLRRMGEPRIISYEYETYVPEMRDNKFSRDVGSEYFYVSRILQTELCSVVLYGCRSYESEGAPVYYVLASFNNKGKLVDKMIVGGAKTFDEDFKEFTALSGTRFQIQSFKTIYEKSTGENGFENNRVVSRNAVGTQRFAIDADGKFVPVQAG